MKILIMGLPGAGKTYLAEKLKDMLGCAWYNADEIRKMSNDWDFSDEGRERQALRMRIFADFEIGSRSEDVTVISDFVCPTAKTREIFEPDFLIWMNTIPAGRYEDTNKIFETPSHADLVIDKFLTDEEISSVVEKILEAKSNV